MLAHLKRHPKAILLSSVIRVAHECEKIQKNPAWWRNGLWRVNIVDNLYGQPLISSKICSPNFSENVSILYTKKQGLPKNNSLILTVIIKIEKPHWLSVRSNGTKVVETS